MGKRFAGGNAAQPAEGGTRASARVTAAVTAALLASSLMAPAVPALATVDAGDVEGLVYVYPSEADNKMVAVAAVTGDVGDTIFVNIMEGESLRAKCLPFTIAESNTDLADDGRVMGMLEIDISQLNPASTYTVQVFNNRGAAMSSEGAVYTGTLTIVRGQFGEGTEPEPIAVSTIAEGEDHGCPAPKQVSRDAGSGKTQLFELVSEEPDENGVYQYQLAESSPTSVEAHVTYVDIATGSQVQQDTYTLEDGQQQSVSIPGLIEVGGTYYHTFNVSGTVTLSYPGTTEATVMCKQVQVPIAIVDGQEINYTPYEATVTYVDTDGNTLGAVDGIGGTTAGLVDTLVVNRPYTYTPPTFVYVTGADGKVQGYKLVDENTSFLFEFPADQTEVQAVYQPIASTGTRSWIINLVNGTVGTEDAGRTISSRTLTGEVGSSASFLLDEIDVNGVTYVPASVFANGESRLISTDASAADRTIAHTYEEGTDAETLTAYYVPKDYVAPGQRLVNVNYVNVANNQVITSQAVELSPDMRADQVIDVPAEFTSGAVRWIRLNGQSDSLRLSYYAPNDTYTVYYRDVNDDRSERITVTQTVTVYDEVVTYTGTTVTPATTTTTAGTTTTPTTTTPTATTPAAPAPTTTPTAQPGTTPTTLPGQTTQVSSPEGTTNTNPDGTGVTTERIGDEENPLAASPDGQDQKQDKDTESNKILGMSQGALMGVLGAMSATVVGLLIALFGRKGRDGEDGKA